MKVKDLRRLVHTLLPVMAVALVVNLFALIDDFNVWRFGQSVAAVLGVVALFVFVLQRLRSQPDHQRVDLTGTRLRYFAAWLGTMAFLTIGLGGMGYGFEPNVVWPIAVIVSVACVALGYAEWRLRNRRFLERGVRW